VSALTQSEIIEVLVRMRGGQQVNAESRKAASGLGHIENKAKAAEYATERLRIGSGRLQTRLSLLGRSAFTIAGVAGIGGLVEAGRLAVNAFKDQQVASAQTRAVLRSTGGQANVTAREIGELADRGAHLQGVDKATVQTGLNTLLTFRKIRNEVGKGNDVFNQAARLTQDLSVARHMDIRTAALWVGKALNDPVRGFARLQRVGVSFTKAQQDQIKLYDALGMRAEAQKVILSELQRTVGGSAASFGNTLPGAIGKAKLAITELGVSVGTKLAPYITIGALKVAGFAGELRDGTGAGGRFIGMVRTGAHVLAAIFGPPIVFALRHLQLTEGVLTTGASAWLGYRTAVLLTTAAIRLFAGAEAIATTITLLKLIPAITSLEDAMVLLGLASVSTAGALGAALFGLAAVFVLLYLKVGWFRNAVNATWDAVKTGAGAVIGFLRAHWPYVLLALVAPFALAVVLAVKHSKAIANAFISAINFVIRAWDSLHFHIPGFKVFGHHLGGFTIGAPHIAQIPLLAEGGTVAQRGAAIVGEAGPELVDLPAGAKVTPLARQPKQIIQLVVDGRVLAETVLHHAEAAAARA
jgi:hypothetical protein